MRAPQTINIKIPRKAFLPCYLHLLDSTADINFLWGGRDSGKSYFIASRLIMKCLTAKYFRCLLIKKTFNTIQESQWQTIKDICEAWGISHLFNFRTAPLSIVCKQNGNKFIARGCDDPQSIKSVKDPSDAWYEEGNQLTLDDFITVSTTLRTDKAKIQQWFSFNPECDVDPEEFWLYTTFFKNKSYNGTYEWVVDSTVPGEPPVTYTYTSTHTTYHDNHKCTAQRIVFLEKLKEISPYYYEVYTLGHWGRRENNAPFAYAFDREKHINPTTLNYRHELMLSFDFNRNPISCLVAQWYDEHFRIIESIKLENSDIYKLCDYINLHYTGTLLTITGDATGQASSALVQDNLNYYTVIKEKLNLGVGQMLMPSKNPVIKENQVLVNAVLATVKTSIDPKKGAGLIYDLENVKMLPDGTIEKRDRNNPAQQADILDCFRYMCNTYFKWVLKN